MRIKDYLKDNIWAIMLYTILILSNELLLVLFNINQALRLFILLLSTIIGFSILMSNFIRKKIFYDNLIENLKNIDQKYLIQEIIKKPNFLEGEILYETLYESNKAMKEKLNQNEQDLKEFKDYLEMWIHDVKIPLSTAFLLNHNKKEKQPELENELLNIEDYLNQILYYARSETTEKDFLIRQNELSSIINKVITRHKNSFIYQKISLVFQKEKKIIYTDSKWLEFILNQILSNSIKYSPKENAVIKIEIQENKKEIKLKIEDNGIGIEEKDISRVFEKSFTGENGRKIATSTGMGLYICKKLCDKLGHKIEIQSHVKKGTIVTLTFYKNDYYAR